MNVVAEDALTGLAARMAPTPAPPRKRRWLTALMLLVLGVALLLAGLIASLPLLGESATISIDEQGVVLQQGSLASAAIGLLIAGLVLTLVLAVVPVVLLVVLASVFLLLLVVLGVPLLALLGVAGLLMAPVLIFLVGGYLLLRRLLREPRAAAAPG